MTATAAKHPIAAQDPWTIFEPLEIEGLLPHRPPFLFVDRAELDPQGRLCRTWHSFLPEEPYFEGHFPGNPIVPGVVLIECMAQAARLLLNARAGAIKTGFLVGVDATKFTQAVRPRDLLRIEARLERDTGDLTMGGSVHSFKCSAYLGKSRCARAQIDLYQAIP